MARRRLPPALEERTRGVEEPSSTRGGTFPYAWRKGSLRLEEASFTLGEQF